MREVLQQRKPWAVILAGGDGRRLGSLTRRITGQETPKQFCALLGGETLLETTLRRIRPFSPSERTLTVVTRQHEQFYSRLLSGSGNLNLLIQPQNRGTAPAILYAISRIASLVANPIVAIFPSDHYFGNDADFLHYVGAAVGAVETRPEFSVVLGVPASSSETGYGWIEPGSYISREDERPGLQTIHRFWEKPSAESAQRFLESGYLWNSFVIVARVSTLLGMFMICTPGLYRAFTKIRPLLGTFSGQDAIERLYRDTPSSGFSEQVLASCPPNLATIAMYGIEWSDLGEPERVMAVLSRAGLHPRWAAA